MRNDEMYLARIKEAMDNKLLITNAAPRTNKTINCGLSSVHPNINMICGLCNERIKDDSNIQTADPCWVYIYCDTCKVVYYYDPMCASSWWHESGREEVYGHYITQWQDMETDIVYEGMPVFENAEDWIKHRKKINVLKLWCYDGSCQCPIDEPSYI